MKTLKSLFVLLLLTVPTLADVIVWSGGGTLQVGDATSLVTRPRLYHLVTEQANLQSSLIIVTPSLRTVKVIGPFNVGYAEVGIARARTIFLASGSAAFVGVNNFQNVFLRFKGVKTNLFLRSGNQNPAALPSVLASTYNDVNGLPQAITGAFTMRFDRARTHENNAANRTLPTALNDIVGKYTAKGYTVVP